MSSFYRPAAARVACVFHLLKEVLCIVVREHGKGTAETWSSFANIIESIHPIILLIKVLWWIIKLFLSRSDLKKIFLSPPQIYSLEPILMISRSFQYSKAGETKIRNFSNIMLHKVAIFLSLILDYKCDVDFIHRNNPWQNK